METTLPPRESRTPLWIIIAAAIVAVGAALAGHSFSASSNERVPPSALRVLASSFGA